jgi:predicted permease
MFGMLERLWRDIRYAVRSLRKSPGFSVAAIVTLALGIGATTAMFSVINGVLLRPLPYRDPQRLAVILEHVQRLSNEPVGLPPGDVLTFQRDSRAFEGVAGYRALEYEVSAGGNARQVEGVRASWNLFSVLGVTPALGRSFTAEEDHPGVNVAIISHGMWQSDFAGGRDVIGRTVTIDRVPHTIIGVMPAGFQFPLTAETTLPQELWVPMAFTDAERTQSGTNFNFAAVARLKPGFTLRQARADADSLGRQIEANHPPATQANLKMEVLVRGLGDFIFGNYRSALGLLFAAVACLLLIAISNVANLMLTRASSRQQEMAIRMALGAGGGRIGLQLVTEGVVLGVIGGSLGVLLAAGGTRALLRLVPTHVPRLEGSGLDWRVLLFALGVAVLSGIAFGLAPALFAMRANMNDSLKTRGATLSRRHRLLRTGFAGLQMALAVVLLVGCGLLIRSFQRTLQVDPGFRPEHMIAGWVRLPLGQYSSSQQIKNFLKSAVLRLQEIPGASAAAASTDLPLKGSWQGLISAEGHTQSSALMYNALVVGDYFQVAGIPMVRGRAFTAADDEQAPRVAIISEKLAKREFGDSDPIGQRIKYGIPSSQRQWMTIVGIAGDTKPYALDGETVPHVYAPFVQMEDKLVMQYPINFAYVAIRTSQPAEAAVAAVRRAIQSLDRDLPVTELETMDQIMSASVATRRFDMVLVMIFAGLALLLASIGIYGVIAYSVTQRTREIGVRMTLGASRADVLRLVLRGGTFIALAGVSCGVAGALILTRTLQSFLFEVRPSDPLTFAAVALLLMAVALVASYVPARRAASIDPTIALRSE